MLMKWIWFLSFINIMDAQLSCQVPTLEHGRVRRPQRYRSSRLRTIRYACNYGYSLVGKRFATCFNGEWDEPLPVCVKSGCSLPLIEHGTMSTSKNDAWVVFFCFPGYVLSGNPALYCDGKTWNGTAPQCIEKKSSSPQTSCDFESPDLCGWTQDSYHDFDWTRLKGKTPSSFMNTGPSVDHTYGEGKTFTGYYMYIESSSRLENDTARLLSPVYDKSLSNDGCFVLYYHMYGKGIGGLRVYQVPIDVHLDSIRVNNERIMKRHLLFERWGNQGNEWWGEVTPLINYDEDFQIVVEGIRGKNFDSDIAIDDVSLERENCTALIRTVSTPAPFPAESCFGRCGAPMNSRDCGCTEDCFFERSCCHDYVETCMFRDSRSTDVDQTSTSEALPQTQRLIAPHSSTSYSTTSTSTSRTSTSTSTTTERSTTERTTTTTTTKRPQPTPKVIRVYTRKPVTPPTPRITTPKAFKNVTVFQKDAITDDDTTNETSTAKVLKYHSLPPHRPVSPKLPNTTAVPIQSRVTTAKVPTKTTEAKKSVKIGKSVPLVNVKAKHTDVSKKTSAWKPVLIMFAVLLCCCGLAWFVKGARGARGWATLAALRGRVQNDPEVRYLHSDHDDEI